jgi:hypothetical protein
MSPVRLTDSELATVMAAARPIAHYLRDQFLQAVANELARCGQVGPGVVHRICVTLQRQFFDPPDLDGAA